jgi:hypothetical protein
MQKKTDEEVSKAAQKGWEKYAKEARIAAGLEEPFGPKPENLRSRKKQKSHKKTNKGEPSDDSVKIEVVE